MTIEPGWWQCRALGADGVPLWLTLVASQAHPDGQLVELAADAAAAAVGADGLCTAGYDPDGRVTSLRLAPRVAPAAPALWFTEARESAARPPAVSLVAFTGHAAAGTLFDEHDAAAVGVASADQVAAVRWYPGSGEVDQIYVQPAWRRLGVANAMLFAAGTLAVARRWPRLWGDGQRTRLGEQMRTAAPWRHRTAELTHLAPPMTPGDG